MCAIAGADIQVVVCVAEAESAEPVSALDERLVQHVAGRAGYQCEVEQIFTCDLQ